MKITGAVFDFDGTLFDSMKIWEDIGDSYLKHIGQKPSKDISDIFLKSTLSTDAEAIKTKYGIGQSIETITDDIIDHLTERYLTQAKPKNDIIQFLEKLKASGVKMCIATATDEKPVKAALKKYNMLSYFGAIFTPSNVGEEKTNPKMFREALQFLRTDKDTTWVFEDALYAAKTAKEDGFKVVGVYDKSEVHGEDMRRITDVYITLFSEIEINI